jgi:DNA-binding NarL/FixJ family response regulator
LTDREREVLDYMAQGRSNAAIAEEIHCSSKTLETHIRSIFNKLDLPADQGDHRRVAAVVRWLHTRQ